MKLGKEVSCPGSYACGRKSTSVDSHDGRNCGYRCKANINGSYYRFSQCQHSIREHLRALMECADQRHAITTMIRADGRV